jgi:pyruvate/2-oxoglutarate dehydrogenase complex dihydrolipoamide dehydrogenase (E3) component
LATSYARAGANVTILEALPQLLPARDTDAVSRLPAESERIGTKVKTGVSVWRIEPAGSRFRVIFTHDGHRRLQYRRGPQARARLCEHRDIGLYGAGAGRRPPH